MEIADLRLGNLIKISPRPNEEGIIFLAEIQPVSVIGVMLVPRQGYHFRIKFEEMRPLENSEEWLSRFGFNNHFGSNIWIDKKNNLEVTLNNGSCSFADEPDNILEYAHQLQNHYFNKTGEELSPKM